MHMSRPHPSFAVLVGCAVTALALWIITRLDSHDLVFGAAAFTVAAVVTGAVLGVGFGVWAPWPGPWGARHSDVAQDSGGSRNARLRAAGNTAFLLYAVVVWVIRLLVNWIASSLDAQRAG